MFLGIAPKFEKLEKEIGALCGCGTPYLLRYGPYHSGKMGLIANQQCSSQQLKAER